MPESCADIFAEARLPKEPNIERRSLSPEEHALRLKFDATTREQDIEERTRLWTELRRARARGARAKARPFVRIRLNDSRTPLLAACLVSDLKIVSLATVRDSFAPSRRVEAYASCELLFGPKTPLCARAGPCPHDVVVFVLESDNETIPLHQRAYDSLKALVRARTKMRTP
jgi:hypothetical protein